MKIYVQLGEAPLPVDERVRYRAGFKDFVTASNRPEDTRVVLVEPNPDLIPRLEAMWADWGQVEIINSRVTLQLANDIQTFYSGHAPSPFPEVFSSDQEYVRRYFPSGELRETQISQVLITEFLNSVAENAKVAGLSMDLRRQSVTEIEKASWSSLQLDTLILTTDGLDKGELKRLRRMIMSAGFARAGRSWGEARTGETLQKATASKDRLKIVVAQTRVSAGEFAVTISQLIPSNEDRRIFVNKMKVTFAPSFSSADVLDSSYGRVLQPVQAQDVERVIALAGDSPSTSWTLRVESEPFVDQVAAKCFNDHGVWPISFSYPKSPKLLNSDPEQLLCSITPGFPYSFDNENEYLQTYANSYLGLTHRKAGWDCFRHLEIMSSGAIPLMLDVQEIPEYSMIHYPKIALIEIKKKVESQSGRPGTTTRESFREHFENNLTSKAMATYMLRIAEFVEPKRVLFVDEKLPNNADYQSVLALIGLKQIFGVNCEVAFPVEYIYEDTSIDTAQLYGRGFGYTRVLSPTLRTEHEKTLDSPPMIQSEHLNSFDLVVVGSISRNPEIASEVLSKFPAEKTIWIHGEDSPPTIREAKFLRESGTKVFVRSIS